MAITVKQLADLVHGKVLGDGDVPIRAARTIREAGPDDITFVENDTYLPALHASQAAAAIVSPDVPLNGKALVQVDDPLGAFVTIFQHLQGKSAPHASGIDLRAIIHAGVRIGEHPSIQGNAIVGANSTIGSRCQIHSGVVIGRNCRIGDDVVLHPNVVLYDDTVLGDRVILHANCVIGADGFGYRVRHGRHEKVPQLSNVIIGADVEIGSCTTIDRGTFEATVIGDGTKVDNQVQIAHNCKIGKHNLFAAQVGIAGSSTTGDYVVLAGQVGVGEHITIGHAAIVGACASVSNDVEPGARMLGSPARPVGEQRRLFATIHKLPEIRRDVERIKKQIGLEEAA